MKKKVVPIACAFAVLSAFPAYVLVPALWVRTDESVKQDWGARELERRLRLELDGPEADDHPSLRDREPPTRW